MNDSNDLKINHKCHLELTFKDRDLLTLDAIISFIENQGVRAAIFSMYEEVDVEFEVKRRKKGQV